MALSRPVGVFGLKVPPSGIRIDANPGLPAAIQISMAAIDPTELVVSSGDAPPRATLKIVRNIFDVVDDYDSEGDDDLYPDVDDEDDIEAIRRRLGITESDDEEMDEDDEDDDEESEEDLVNGAGPSDPEKTRKKIQEAVLKQLEEDEEDEDMSDIPNGINGKVNKGKARALLNGDDESEDEMSEYVVCTLDPTQHYQQPINITIGENEECYFRVSGSHTVHLTGNFVVPAQDIDDYSDSDSEDEEAEDLEARLLAGLGSDLEDDYEDSEEDELDDLDDPRITEVDSEDEEAPQLITTGAGKKNKKRPAAEENGEDYAAELLEKIAQQEADKPKSKKQKNNEGKAVAAAEVKAESKKEPIKNKKEAKAAEPKLEATNGKKVQFAKELEQGPTPSKTSTSVKKVVQGVTVEDRKIGTGPASKKGDRVGMRYIGKLKDGKVFDSNKKGKPFGFKIGSGEVIKGWDIGVAGMAVGGERRIIVPAHLAYGKKALPGIPANSELTFDLKLISIN